jgi:hypothetical protein
MLAIFAGLFLTILSSEKVMQAVKDKGTVVGLFIVVLAVVGLFITSRRKKAI